MTSFYQRERDKIAGLIADMKAADGNRLGVREMESFISQGRLDGYIGDDVCDVIDFDFAADNDSEVILKTEMIVQKLEERLAAVASKVAAFPELINVEVSNRDDEGGYTVTFCVATNEYEHAIQIIKQAGYNTESFGSGVAYDCSARPICDGAHRALSQFNELGQWLIPVSYGVDI